jgi:hypothetical protein
LGRKAAVPITDTPFDFHLSGQSFNRIERFLQFWAEYPKRDGLKAYLYRVANPCIDSRQSGKRESALQVFENDTAVPTADEILRAWGSGKFQFILNDRLKPDNVQNAARCTFTLDDVDIPPVYNPSDLIVVGEQGEKNRPYIEKWLAAGWSIVEGQTNEVYRDRRGAKEKVPFASLRPASEIAPAAAVAPGAERLNTEAITAIIEKAGAGNNALAAGLLQLLAADRRPAADPLVQLTQTAAALEKLRPAADPNQVQLAGVLVELVKAQNGAARPAAVEPSDPLAQTRSMLAFVKELRESGVVGGGEGGGGFWPAAFGALPSVLTFLTTGIAAARAAASAPAATAATAAPVAVAPAAARVGGDDLPPELQGVGGEMFGLPSELSLADLVRIGKQAISSFSRGVSGLDFAHAVVCMDARGETIYDAMVEAGKVKLLELLKMAGPMAGPEFAAVLAAREPEISAWLDSFLSYADLSPDDEDGLVTR